MGVLGWWNKNFSRIFFEGGKSKTLDQKLAQGVIGLVTVKTTFEILKPIIGLPVFWRTNFQIQDSLRLHLFLLGGIRIFVEYPQLDCF